MPGYANPQALNRYTYVLGNPLRYTDPTGHMLDDGCADYGCGSTTPIVYDYVPGDDDNNNNGDNGKDNGGDCLGLCVPSQDEPSLDMISSAGHANSGDDFLYPYCGGGNNDWYNFFNCASNITQDAALVVDAPFALLELVLIGLACIDGACIVGVGIADVVFNVTGGNSLETGFSFSAAGFSIAADIADDGQWGEASNTTIATGIAGLFMPDPLGDAIIDAYGSGYNHGIFPGINTIIDSLFGE